MRKLSQFLALVVAVLILTGCKFLLPKTYSEGEIAFGQQNYQAAVENFEAAAMEEPDNSDITSALLKANAYRSDQLLAQANALDEKDHDKRIQLLSKAFSHCRKSSTIFHDLLVLQPFKKDKDQPIPIVQDVFPKDIETLEYIEQVYFYSQTMPQMAQEIAALLQSEKNKRNNVLAGVNDAVKMLRDKDNGPIKAYKAYLHFDRYSSYMVKVANARQAIELTLVNYYEARGLHKISKNQFKNARLDFDEALKVIPGSKRGLAGILAITVKKDLNKEKFEKAFSDLESMYRIHPKSRFYAKYSQSTRTQVVKRGLAKAKNLLKEEALENEKLAFDIFHQLIPIARPEAKLRILVSTANDELQRNISKKLVEKADHLHEQDLYGYAGIIATLLSSAADMSGSSVEKHQRKANHAKKISSMKLKLPVTFLAKSENSDVMIGSESFYIWLNDETMKTLKQSNSKKLNFVQPENYPSEITDESLLTSKLPTDQHHEVVMLLEVNKHEFIKTGEDSPRKKSSVYVAERYMVHNVAKDQARLELEEAQALYNESKRLADLAKSECKARASQLGGGLLGDIVGGAACNIATDAIHSSLTGLTDAKTKFYNTPEEIEKIRTERYRYDEYNIKVTGQIKANLFAYDIRNKKRHKLESINLTVEKSGIRRRDVKGSDTEGLRAGDENVPDLYSIEEDTKKKLLAESKSQILNFTQAHYSKRFCQQAQQLASKNMQLASIESLVQCADSSHNGSNDFALASKKISDYIGYDLQFIRLYGDNTRKNFINQKGVSVSDIDRQELNETFLSSMSALQEIR